MDAREFEIAKAYIEVGYFRGLTAAQQQIDALASGLQAKLGGSAFDEVAASMIGPVRYLRLSERVQEILERKRVFLILQLTELTEEDLLAFRNFGQRGVDEVVAALAVRGLGLKGSESPTSPSQREIYELDLEELDLSSRPYTRLTRVGLLGKGTVGTIGELVGGWSECDVMAIEGFGLKSLDELVAALAEHGLELQAPKYPR